MLKEYRRRFVNLNMLLVGSVLLLMLVSVGIFMHQSYWQELRTTMSQVLRPLDTPPQGRGGGEYLGPPNHGDDRDGDQKSIVTVFYDRTTGEVSILPYDQYVEEAILAAAAQAAANMAEPFGTLNEYDMIYYRSENNGLCKIALTDVRYIRASMATLVLYLTLIFAAAMALFYLISRYISKLAVKPMEEAWSREKQFVADVSHDLKTPLTVILANNSILRSEPDSPLQERQRWLDSTEAAAESMRTLVNEMLTLSEMDAAEATPSKERVDLSTLVTKALLQMESVAYDRGITLEESVAKDVAVEGNPEYLRRVTASLMENALKYEPQGGRVSVSLNTQRGRAVLSVQNLSSVIAPEDLPHIFERFYRTDKSRGSQAGHGLGLAIVKRMTELMGGRIQAESRPEDGTVFRVSFECRS